MATIPPLIRVKMLGRFEVWRGDDLVPAKAWRRRKTQTLLKILLAERGRVFTPDQLIDALFPDLAPERALVNLRGRVGELRRALEPDLEKNTDSQYVLTLEGGYCFNQAASCWLDTEVFAGLLQTAQVAQAKRLWEQALSGYEVALELYRGDYLVDDAYEEWALDGRDHWQDRYTTALEGASACHAELSNHERAVAACQQALKLAPLRESLYRRLMTYHYQTGEQADALQAYEACVQRLAEVLDAAPSPETVSLFEQIRDQTLTVVSQVDEPDTKSIAVLPFDNLSAEAESEYFSDGLTEDIIAQLSKIRDLKVISRTSVMLYKNAPVTAHDLGRALGVATILKGSVRSAGGQVRIVAQLIDAGNDEHLWAETYDRQLTDIFAIQTEVAERIAWALQAQISAAEQDRLHKAPTEDVEAYRLYLKGRLFLSQSTQEGFYKAIDHFNQAIAVDAGYALAYAGIADAYSLLTWFNFLLPKEGFLQAKEAALKALELDDALGEAHAALGNIKMIYEWDWESAARALAQALELSPGFATAHTTYSRLFLFQRRFDRALEEIGHAFELDPLSRAINCDYGYTLHFVGRHAAALEQFRKTAEMYPNDRFTHYLMGLTQIDLGAYGKAEDAFQSAERAAGGTDPYLEMSLAAARGIIVAKTGQPDRAHHILEDLIQRPSQRDLASVIATVYAALEDFDQVFMWLERAYEERDPWLCHLNVWPVSEALRADPRFDQLLDKMGFEPSPM